MKKVIANGIGAAVLAASVIVVPALVGPASFTAAHAACEPGDVVDATTAQQAKKQIVKMTDGREVVFNVSKTGKVQAFTKEALVDGKAWDELTAEERKAANIKAAVPD